MANAEAPRTPDQPSPSNPQLSRRQVLSGIAGVAGLAAVPSLLAACGPSGASTAPSTAGAASQAPAGSSAASSSAAAGASLSGEVTLGSNYSDAVPKKAMQAAADSFTAKTGIAVKINTVDHGTFQDQISSYLQGTPDDVWTWFSGFRMRFFAAQGLASDITDVWTKLAPHYTDAFKVGSTGDDGKQYFVPIYLYPWAVFYRKSLFADKGYTIPKTFDEMKTLATKIQKDGLTPFAFGDKDGWPAMGTFDILNLRLNGYDFHVNLMAGKEKWTDPKVKTVFDTFKEILPFHQAGAAGRIWQDASTSLVQKKSAMYFHGMFTSQQFQEAGQADLDDLDFFPYPDFGTQYDAEKALDAPIDGFALSKAPKNVDAAKAFVEHLGQPETQVAWVSADKSNIAAAKDADTSNYTALQKKAAEVIGQAQRITQFLDRDTNPNFAGPNGMQAFLLQFLQDPNQDVAALQKKIQDFWDTL
ncbi:MAG TPA: ABC transporter substrate-binding protein [Candidatus Limnocylindrales bacterium]|nr:ABC transporter substrate-binding protein [Candidatus Limnocylindrales bacterium]